MTAPRDLTAVELAGLKIPTRYHQGVNERVVNHLRPFDRTLGGAITILATPDGERYIVDGVQRVSAARRDGLTHLRGYVYHDAYEKYVELFQRLNGRRPA